MRRITVRLGAMLAAVVAALSAVSAPAGAATGELSASCDITLTTNGGPAGSLTVRGAYRLLGSVPATSPTTAPLTAEDWGVWLRLDMDVLGPELTARGVRGAFDQAYSLAAYLSVFQDGVEDWPQKPPADLGRGITVDQLAAGVTGPTTDARLYPGDDALPGRWRFASYGDVWFAFHAFADPQTYMGVHCTADPGQDLFWGETVVA